MTHQPNVRIFVTFFPRDVPGGLLMNPLSFEKDDDSNGHIDFITAASVSQENYR